MWIPVTKKIYLKSVIFPPWIKELQLDAMQIQVSRMCTLQGVCGHFENGKISKMVTLSQENGIS